MDRALDEVISERQRPSRGGRTNRRRDQGRDNTRQNGRDYANLDDEWIHDKYDEDDDGSRRPGRRLRPGRYTRDSPEADPFGRDKERGTKIRVENLHWDLTQDDLRGLFTRIGPVSRISLDYDRAGRSTGTAYVTYSELADAREAIREFDGANARGQPIRLTLLPSGPGARAATSRSLFDRIEGNGGDSPNRSRNRGRDRSRSRSPGAKRAELRAHAREDIDRYVPEDRGGRNDSPKQRERRPDPRRRGGRNERAERRPPRMDDHGRPMVGGRPRMTQEELDKDMDEYFKKAQTGIEGSGQDQSSGRAPNSSAAAEQIADDDIDMVE